MDGTRVVKETWHAEDNRAESLAIYIGPELEKELAAAAARRLKNVGPAAARRPQKTPESKELAKDPARETRQARKNRSKYLSTTQVPLLVLMTILISCVVGGLVAVGTSFPLQLLRNLGLELSRQTNDAILAGVFILMEDTIAVGDVARVAGHAGIVEALSIRTIRLRDLGGTVHVIPFSEVASIENLTKDFSYALMEVGVAYREDTDEVVEVLKEVGAELQVDPEVGPNILEPLEVLGVDAFADSAVVIKIHFKTLPIKQWATKRAFNRLMKKAFDARGIEIPFPHTTLYFGEDKQGRAPPAHVAMQRPQAGPGA